MLFHNLEAPKVDSWYPCNSCDYKSKRKDNTERHKKTHLKTKPAHECSHCGKVFKKGASLKKHLERCRQFVPLKIGEEEVVKLLSSGFNKKKVKTVLKFVQKISGRLKVETNLMKTVNTSIKNLEKWFTSEQITLRRNPEGKKKVRAEYSTAVAYCTNVKGFMEFIRKNRKIKNARYLISADGGMYDIIRLFDIL